MFQVIVFDENSERHDLGSVKIGFKGQTTKESTHSSVDWPVKRLPKYFFSLGTDVEYYEIIGNSFSEEFRNSYCAAMRDIVFDRNILNFASDEDVFKTSLMRSGSISTIHGQYARVLYGGVPLTDFDFEYVLEQTETYAGYRINFNVKAGSTPRTNIHALIGRNGVGKTSFLNDLVLAALSIDEARGQIVRKQFFSAEKIEEDYFSRVISISFSAFDPFAPPEDRPEPDEGPSYHYVGIKEPDDPTGSTLKTTETLHQEFVEALKYVLSEAETAKRWAEAIGTLESDENFAEMRLARLISLESNAVEEIAFHLVGRMSSGHAIVILIITKLVAFVQEKTLVLIDEPESHLHPPLLSALTRSISDLLFNRNGVALIATHSPVVLQEIPQSCVWKITRSHVRMDVHRPIIETFAENVGILTREVFGLEVSKSGFHKLLVSEVQEGKTYDQIMSDYGDQIGFEGQALLRTLIAERESE